MMKQQYDAVVVGAGFAGLYMLYRLRGIGLSARVYEAGDGVGGTWYWNRYPGARCDVESMDYSYSFSDELQQEWHWTERYASQPEILRYINHVADRFDLRRDIQLSTRVTEAVFDTGRWPHEGVDFTGQRVAVIGTGSSAIQSIPLIAEQAKHLTVFQRTPNYSIPAHNVPLDPEYERQVKAIYTEFRQAARQSRIGFVVPVTETPALSVSAEEREREYEARWQRGGLGFGFSFPDLLIDEQANETAAEFFRNKIRSIVQDPAVAATLAPRGYPLGTKRMCVDTDYYVTFNRDNVTLVALCNTPIETITPQGLRTIEKKYEVDAIVFAIGYDAMTADSALEGDGFELSVPP
jgi:cyclohexanone monooxygenase